MKTKIIAILVFASLMTKLNAQNHDKVCMRDGVVS